MVKRPLEANEEKVKSKRNSPLRGGLRVIKPAGPSSFDVIRRLKEILPRGTRMGHTGTLDPAASGLLLVLIGTATRIQHLLKDLDKEYEAVIRLGVATDTDDMEGRVTERAEVPLIAEGRIKEVLSGLEGTRMQRPPRYSALKVDGKRAYAKARSGEAFELPERTVTVFNLKLVSWDAPFIRIKTVVSAGTYIRSLAREIGGILGVPASLSSLVRTRIGQFAADDALGLDELSKDSVADKMISVLELLSHLPRARISYVEAEMLIQGKPLDENAYTELQDFPLSILYTADKSRAFLCKPQDGRLRSRRLLYTDDSEGF
ncbi:tRNA pseudouridine(55) synthase TruB [candidate division WOR-3 bacterium]|uniref:tRNA pseudouridine synthase B n=1 Tax=candidate division WOR-3 bacterium TaxID=2052148 RepID=A0A9D5K8T4_UNCW3|nr:tRNA pseudouridine(55) synthase TruB [candidate division WOR-3 bacterium]MBD3363709.1 tRNA pseudouridine(55) synthase TruB [candidate division WOR-3 bacterium]